jgi:phosphatidate cytidylyltransferase
MAFNITTFKTRALTAVVFVIVMLGGLLWNSWSFFILFSIIHFGCWSEYQKLVGQIDPGYKAITPFHKYGVRLAGWCIMLYFTGDDIAVSRLHLHEIGWWLGLVFVFILPIIELLFAREIQLKNIGHSAFGLVYISLSWGFMMDLYNTGPGECFTGPGWYIPVAIIAIIWINDTMAYIVGSFIGKTPFSKISPKKTWEGTIGGIIICTVIAALVGKWNGTFDIPLLYSISFALIVSITGTAGDLLESKLKRLANVKDSGRIMPGHGGFLDRFDSLLIAIPFVWLYLKLVM